MGLEVNSEGLAPQSDDQISKVSLVNAPRVDSDHSWRSDQSDSGIGLQKLKDYHNYLFPTRDIVNMESNSVDYSKRSHNFNGADVKQEASVMPNSSSPVQVFSTVSCQTVALLISLMSSHLLIWPLRRPS